jgi:spermidine synthase
MTGDALAPAPTRVGHRTGPLLALVAVSGFAALVYQVLWVRELGLLFGNTAQAAALTIAIFFTGLATGGWCWGRRAGRHPHPLRGFGLLEVGVAAAALTHFVLLDVYHLVEPHLLTLVTRVPAADTLVKAAVAAALLLPASFLMGGTLPMVGQHLIRDRGRLGTTGTLLYAVNTTGSAIGALAAGFVLPLALGLRGAYLLAVSLDLLVGAAAIALAVRTPRTAAAPPVPSPAPATTRTPTAPADARPARRDRTWRISPRLAAALAFTSGTVTLGVEVIWTRLFSQVLQNSAYTYALVLTTFLVALAAGSTLANVLMRSTRLAPERVMVGLLALSTVAAASSPWVFHHVTDGLAYVGADRGWWGYVAAVAATAVTVMLVPGTVLGAVLPSLLRVVQEHDRPPGETIGRLLAWNTGGAIVGALVTGFLLLPAVGASRSLLVLAAVYPLVLVPVLHRGVRSPQPHGAATSWRRAATRTPTVAAAVAAIGLLVVEPTSTTVVRVAPGTEDRVLAVREGPAATVAVLERGDDRRLRVNNHYTLGGTAATVAERDQTLIPLLLHPDPASVFFLGLGTGITAGAAVSSPVERVTVCELLPEVVDLAASHFERWTDGLFEDPRVTVRAEDGRTCLRRSPDRHDLIISDLFTPWKAGTGSLYTVEHFATARDRLTEDGLFVQWLPLYQVSEEELATIAASLQEVFPLVTLWRGDLLAERSAVALVGHVDPAPLDPASLAARGRTVLRSGHSEAALEALTLRLYLGNLTASEVFRDAPTNTDDRPRIEYRAPRTHREVRAGERSFLTGEVREELYDQLLRALPPEDDPYLAWLEEAQRGYVHAGRSYSRAAWLRRVGADAEANDALTDFRARSPAGSTQLLTPARLRPPRT